MLSIIPNEDGYTAEAYLAEFPGVHGEHRIKYRPMLHQERYVVGSAVASKTPAESSQLVASSVAKFVKQWDVQDSKGIVLPIDSANCARLKPSLLERFYGIVSGREGGDPDPESAPKNEALDAQLAAIMEDRSIGQVKEETDLKN